MKLAAKHYPMVGLEMFREFEDLRGDLAGAFSRRLVELGTWSPLVDVFEEGKELIVRAELAGLKLEDVKVWLEKDVLTIEGVRNFENDDEKRNFHRQEVPYGKFQRRVVLPDVKADPDPGVVHERRSGSADADDGGPGEQRDSRIGQLVPAFGNEA